VRDIIALAHERELPVLIHAGRGIPALGQDTVKLSEEFRGARLILAHCAISDLAWLWRLLPDHPKRVPRHGMVGAVRPDRHLHALPAAECVWAQRLALRAADRRRVHGRSAARCRPG
jgi:hypothetical protein